ncbi:hypothetical protein NX801_03345 [Streptomyces sp. LP05-1]|uniref:Uncharacterized protein n=1 Tax=Streptomyces pyxinae TaxID=2970734 RepID=A0ABT2CBE4_9ACTN|nr:hypothetical protein [Streptomyces sp. LP05-1]MCS0634709.1 hypothetical protein [Streptomyces sp. LP05-1]
MTHPYPASAGPVPLIVPVRVEALAVNERVRQAEVFQRWEANYALTRLHLSPEPPPFSNTDTAFTGDPDREGVYLHWQLPRALTHGTGGGPVAREPGPGGAATPGTGAEAAGAPVFPLVPNRWLVVRQAVAASGERRETGWVVESDHLDPAGGTSPYLHPGDGSLTRIGRRVDLADGAWTEPGTPGGLFLTAVGPGLPTFAAYQPYNADVFSVHDRTDDLDPLTAWRLNYLVAGWYGDPAADPLAGDAAARMAALAWTAGGPVPPGARTLCHGTVIDLAWQRRGGPLPASDQPDYLTVGIGNTTEHATGALLDPGAAFDPAGPEDPAPLARLLAAAHHGLLDTLDAPDGEHRAQRAEHTSWFTPDPAGHTWVLEDAGQRNDGAPATPRAPRAVRETRAAVLAGLNADQAAHDRAERELASARRRLYDLWWAAGLPKVPDAPGERAGAYREDLRARLADATDLAARLRERVAELRRRIPWGNTPEELAAAITAYQEQHSLDPATTVLKRSVLPPYQLPNDPVVVLKATKAQPAPPPPEGSGATPEPYPDEPDASAGDGPDEEPLLCRWPDQLVTGVRVAGTEVSAPPAALPQPPNLPEPAGLGAVLLSLLGELCHLAPSDAPTLARAAGYQGDLGALAGAMGDPAANAVGTPGAYTAAWRQPWSPLFFEWQAEYHPIDWRDDDPRAEDTAAHWEFDGYEYHWRGTGAHSVPLTLSGRQFLTPAAGTTLAGALRQYARTHPGPHTPALRALARRAEDSGLFSQQLTGFTAQLAARSTTPAALTPFTVPEDDLRTALTEAAARALPPDPGPRPRPFTGWAAPLFQQLRAGQFAVARLAVVDRFGHTLPAVKPDPRAVQRARYAATTDVTGVGTPARAFAPRLPPELTPSLRDPDHPDRGHHTVNPPTWYRFVQLTPRLPQPARVHFTLLDARDDTTELPTAADPATTPVAAWLVPGHLDRTLSCYAPDGRPLGQLRTTLPPDGRPRVTWQALPYSGHTDLESLRADHAQLYAFLTGLTDPARGRGVLGGFLDAIGLVLDTVAPTGDAGPAHTTAPLVGRPLALCRARLDLDLDGPPYTDPSWRNLRENAPPAYPDYRWPVRLGERSELGDGLVGYFGGVHRDTDYSRLYTVLADSELPDAGRQYLTPIGTGASLALAARVPADDPDHLRAAHLTLLLDPRSTVHATSDVLPAAELTLPARLVEPPLARLPVSFRLGPLPTVPYSAGPPDGTRAAAPPALELPRPSDRLGTWEWVQRDSAGGWATTATRPADDRARHPRPVPVLRTGRISLRPGDDDTPDAPPDGPAALTDPADPMDPMEPADPADPMDPMDPTEGHPA